MTGPLIQADELLRLVRAGTPNLRIVDCRWILGSPGAGTVAYTAGHLPGAIHLDLDGDLSVAGGYGAPGRHPLPDPATFADCLGEVGIGDDDLVIAYDDVGGWVAARLWWMLDVLGHEQVAVLDGGIAAWQAAGGELTQEVPVLAPATIHLADRWTRVIHREELRSRLGSVVLLDARAGPRYRGETEPIDPVAGRIPGARNRYFLDPSPLPADLREAPGLVVYCGSGVTACAVLHELHLAGRDDARLYPGSFSEWYALGPVERD